MAAYTYVTGPVYHYIAFYTPDSGSQSQTIQNSTIKWLGTSEVTPRARTKRAYKPVMNDIGGQLLPLDRIYQGQECQIVTALNRYDEDVYQQLASAPRYNIRNINVPGLNNQLDIGALVQGNFCFFSLILQFPFAKTINAPDNMPKGYIYNVCVSEQDDFNQMGTAERQTFLAITAQRYFVSSADPTKGTFRTYTTDFTGITLPPVN